MEEKGPSPPLQINRRAPGRHAANKASEPPSQQNVMAQSLYKPPLTPLSAATAAGARRLLDYEQRHQKTPDQVQTWSLTPEHPQQSNVAGFAQQSKNAPLDWRSTNRPAPQASGMANERAKEAAPVGNQAQVNREFVDQLNKTEEALQKFRRAASNYREHAYRARAVELTDGSGHGPSLDYQREQTTRPAGRYA